MTNNKWWRGCGGKGTFIFYWWECKLVQSLWRTGWRFLKKWSIVTVWSWNPLPSHVSGENSNFKLYMTNFIYIKTLGVQPCCYKWQNAILYDGCIVFHCIYVPQLLYPFICWWTLRLLPYIGNCKQLLLWKLGCVYVLKLVFLLIFRSLLQILQFTPNYTKVEFLGHVLVLFLVFWETSKLFSTVAAQVYILSNSVWGLLFLHILANHISWWFGFIFPWWLDMLSIFSSDYWPSAHPFWKDVYSDLLPIFSPTLHDMHNFPNQGSNPRPPQWKYGVSTTGRMEKSCSFFKIRFIFFNVEFMSCLYCWILTP